MENTPEEKQTTNSIIKRNVRGSNTGLFINGQFLSQYDSSCPRTILIRDLGLEERKGDDFPVFVLGRDFERWFKTTLITEYTEEYLAKFDITENIGFEGHADVVVGDTVYELKSLTSMNTERQVFKRGKPKKGNLIQLIGYMLSSDRVKGKLIYGSYTDVIEYKTLLELTADEVLEIVKNYSPRLKIFNVELTDVGKVLVDGIEQNFVVDNIVDFWQESAKFLEQDENAPLPAKPADMDGKGNPCFFCPMNKVCLQNPVSKKQFTEMAQNLIDKQQEDMS